jgi:glucokinase
MSRGLGIDLGGTRIKVGWAGPGGLEGELVIEPTAAERGPDEVLSQIVALAAPRLAAHETSAVGVAVPGLVDASTGHVIASPNFPSWRDVPIVEVLGERLGVPVAVLNDASAATWGEAQVGAGVGAADVAGFTLGTGVGGGLVLDGVLRTGASGMAAEFGHIVVDPGGRPCGCGGRGCLEQMLGADAIRARLMDGSETWAAGAALSDPIPALFDAARSGQAEALELVDRGGRALGYAIASVALVVDVQRIVLMGGLAAGHDLLIPAAYIGLRERLYDAMADRIHIVPGLLGPASGAVGAALWASRSGS